MAVHRFAVERGREQGAIGPHDHAARVTLGVGAADLAPLTAAGGTRAQIGDALEVAFAFNVVTRLADTFGFAIGPESAFEASARHLLKRGYLL